MKCPKCGGWQCGVVDSKEAEGGKQRNRKRKCSDCGTIFQTKEIIIWGEPSADFLPTVLSDGAYAPERAHPTDAGLDLRSPIDTNVPARGKVVVDTGVAVAIPEGYAGLIASKSGMMLEGITSRGLIDSSFRGTIKAVLYNSSGYDYPVDKGNKVTQLVIFPVATPEIVLVDELPKTDRGSGGFGSTGK